jgi:TrmH family RNA methyltransferase
MLSKAKIQYIQSLKLKKFRQKYGVFVVEGDKIAAEVLTAARMMPRLRPTFIIENIIATDIWQSENAALLKPFLAQLITVSAAELKAISNLSTPNQVLLLVKIPLPLPKETSGQKSLLEQYDRALIENKFFLYLDGIQDPGNMGSILRIADWFSIPYVFCSDSCVDIWNPKVVQASMGSFLRVHSQELPFVDLKNQFTELPVFATILRGYSVFDKTQNFPKHGIIVIGNEGAGISPQIIEQADYKITIPGGGGAESLNAAVSAGIVVAALSYG